MSTKRAMELICDCKEQLCRGEDAPTCGFAIVDYAKTNGDIWHRGRCQGWSHEMVGPTKGTRRDYCPACTAHRAAVPGGGAR